MCLCECICGTLGIGDSMNKQKADNLSDVTLWPCFIFREGIFLQLLRKVVSLSRGTMHVSSRRFFCSDAQIVMCVWTTRYHVRPCLWHNHLRSNGGGGETTFCISKDSSLPDRERKQWSIFGTNSSQMNKSLSWFRPKSSEDTEMLDKAQCWALLTAVPLHPCFKTSNPVRIKCRESPVADKKWQVARRGLFYSMQLFNTHKLAKVATFNSYNLLSGTWPQM